jgi:hypothetical protein
MRMLTSSNPVALAAEAIASFSDYLYERPGHNHWAIRLGEDSFVHEGFGPNEFFWWCEGGHLVFVGTDGKRKSFLSPTTQGNWSGSRVDAERMVVNVIALPAPQ